MSPDRIVGRVVPRGVRSGSPNGDAVVAGVDAKALVAPLVVTAVLGFRHDQAEAVEEDVRGVDPQAPSPTRVTKTERSISDVAS